MQNLNLQEKIICHINYRDVFNAPVLKTSLIKWLGVDDSKGRYEFDNIINELKYHELIIEKEGYFAVFGKEDIIDDQPRKTALTKQLIQKGSKGIKLLSSLPFVKYVGVSGSLAADNPTKEFNDEHIDLDLFVVTTEHTMWLFVFIERIFSNVVRAIYKNHFYCCNYVTEESFLEIHNQNLYTATEMVNLKTISNRDSVYENLVDSNFWYTNYYHEKSIKNGESVKKGKMFWSWIISPINFFLVFCFVIVRTLKRFDMKALREINFSFNPAVRFNVKRVCNPNGGYQELIKQSFQDKLIHNFNVHYSQRIVESCFPSGNGMTFQPESNSYDLDVKQLFRKYTLKEK